jgi:histone H3/H4
MSDIEQKQETNANLEEEKLVDKTSKTDEDEEEILEDDEKLPFPNARVVRLMRESLDPNKQIKSVVKKEMNLFLGRIVTTICKKMNEFDYSYVDYGMFKQAIETFENIQTIELEKIRIIKALEKIKADCDVLVNDVERKFHE